MSPCGAVVVVVEGVLVAAGRLVSTVPVHACALATRSTQQDRHNATNGTSSCWARHDMVRGTEQADAERARVQEMRAQKCEGEAMSAYPLEMPGWWVQELRDGATDAA